MPIGMPVVENQRHPFVRQSLEFTAVPVFVADADNNAVDHETLHQQQVFPFPLRVFPGLGDDYLQPFFIKHSLHPVDDPGIKRSVHFGHEDADRVRASRLQVDGYGVTPVSQPLCGLQHLLFRFGTNIPVSAQRPGNGRNRDGKRSGDVLYGYMLHNDTKDREKL